MLPTNFGAKNIIMTKKANVTCLNLMMQQI
jgi:hypothetical protein